MGKGAPNEDNGIIVEWRVVRSYDSDVSGLMVNAVVQSMLSSKFLTFQHHILNILLHSDTGIHKVESRRTERAREQTKSPDRNREEGSGFTNDASGRRRSTS